MKGKIRFQDEQNISKTHQCPNCKNGTHPPKHLQPDMRYHVGFIVETSGYEKVLERIVYSHPLIQDGTYRLIRSKQIPEKIREKSGHVVTAFK